MIAVRPRNQRLGPARPRRPTRRGRSQRERRGSEQQSHFELGQQSLSSDTLNRRLQRSALRWRPDYTRRRGAPLQCSSNFEFTGSARGAHSDRLAHRVCKLYVDLKHLQNKIKRVEGRSAGRPADQRTRPRSCQLGLRGCSRAAHMCTCNRRGGGCWPWVHSCTYYYAWQ